ncbi:MAG TPA: helical backbone metal receptor [Candidatus Binataceae bacterium]|nr:helical backbone metal receptor [Candidatus Binataceae bacterium]
MAWLQTADDLGFRVELARAPERIVSIVPSWTETLFALGLGREVVGVTRYCVEPADAVAAVTKIGGTKNPNIKTIVELRPELVIANAEENRREDIEQLRAAGIAVFTTYPRKISAAVESLLKLGTAVGRAAEAAAMAREIVLAVSEIETSVGVWSKLRFRVFCPIWKNPWMVFNADTYAHDVLRMLGYSNIFATAGERYPRTTLAEAIELRPDFVLLPDEPYEFGARDVEELKPLLPAALARRVVVINGRDLHWYGAHMVSGLKSLSALLSRVRASAV